MQEFEIELQESGYHIDSEIFKECDHNDDVMVYVHQCECCVCPEDKEKRKIFKYSDLNWYRYSMCEKCLDSFLGCMECGGHYTNMRIFIHNKPEEEYFWKPPKSDILVYSDEETDEKKYKSIEIPGLDSSSDSYFEVETIIDDSLPI